MAVDDVISDTEAHAATTATTFQPAAGVEVVLTAFGSEVPSTADQMVLQFDGTRKAIILKIDGENEGMNVKMGVTNTNFFTNG